MLGALQVIGSIFGVIWVIIAGIATMGIGLLFIPIPIIFFIIGALSLFSGIKGLNKKASYGLSLGVAISQMALIFLCDVLSFGGGLAALILLLQTEVKAYFR